VYDDFIENRLGAAAELEAYLNRVPQAWTYSPASSHPSSAASPVFSPTGGPSPLSSISAWSSPGSANPYGQMRWDVSKQSTRVVANNAYKTNLTSYINTLWLYTCVNEGRWCTKMRHLDVNASKVSSDKDLALALSALYTQVNRRWSKVLKLRGLVTIRFVQVSNIDMFITSTTNARCSSSYTVTASQMYHGRLRYLILAALTDSATISNRTISIRQ
jgi:hypothetical protein